MGFRTKVEHAKFFQDYARKNWFKSHQVIVHTCTDEETDSFSVSVVDFKRPDTNKYAIRYIFAGHYVYVSGDLGCAVFDCTWKPTPTDLHWTDIWYVFKKLSASENGLEMAFDEDVCRGTIDDCLLETNAKGEPKLVPKHWNAEQATTYLALCSAAHDCDSTDEWVRKVCELEDESHNCLTSLDPDFWEWLPSAGNVMPLRIIGIITGLQIVSERLRRCPYSENRLCSLSCEGNHCDGTLREQDECAYSC